MLSCSWVTLMVIVIQIWIRSWSSLFPTNGSTGASPQKLPIPIVSCTLGHSVAGDEPGRRRRMKDVWADVVCCRGENGSATEEQREEDVGEVWHVYTAQRSASPPAETVQVHGSLLGLWHASRGHSDGQWQGLGGTTLLSIPSPRTCQVLQGQAADARHLAWVTDVTWALRAN